MRRACALGTIALIPMLGAVGQDRSPPGNEPFSYAHHAGAELAERVAFEREAAADAGRAGRAEQWSVTVLLLLEMVRATEGAVARAMVLDAALAELTRANSRELIGALPDTRRYWLRSALEALDPQDPAGVRAYTRDLAERRLVVVRRDVLEADDPNAGLDALLAAHGWTAEGGVGPQGRQRVRDRADYRAADRQEVAGFEGMTRWHLLLPPTEALEGVPLEELDRKWQRARNLTVHLDRTWAHQDGPRIHDFLLDLMLRDNTGIVRLVHADTQRLAHADRLRRWRLREAMWRLRP